MKSDLQNFLNRWVATADYGRAEWYVRFRAELEKKYHLWRFIDRALEMISKDAPVAEKLQKLHDRSMWEIVIMVVAAGLKEGKLDDGAV